MLVYQGISQPGFVSNEHPAPGTESPEMWKFPHVTFSRFLCQTVLNHLAIKHGNHIPSGKLRVTSGNHLIIHHHSSSFIIIHHHSSSFIIQNVARQGFQSDVNLLPLSSVILWMVSKFCTTKRMVQTLFGWWFQPLWQISKNMRSSVGMISNPIYGKNRFQTTNQLLPVGMFLAPSTGDFATIHRPLAPGCPNWSPSFAVCARDLESHGARSQVMATSRKIRAKKYLNHLLI